MKIVVWNLLGQLTSPEDCGYRLGQNLLDSGTRYNSLDFTSVEPELLTPEFFIAVSSKLAENSSMSACWRDARLEIDSEARARFVVRLRRHAHEYVQMHGPRIPIAEQPESTGSILILWVGGSRDTHGELVKLSQAHWEGLNVRVEMTKERELRSRVDELHPTCVVIEADIGTHRKWRNPSFLNEITSIRSYSHTYCLVNHERKELDRLRDSVGDTNCLGVTSKKADAARVFYLAGSKTDFELPQHTRHGLQQVALKSSASWLMDRLSSRGRRRSVLRDAINMSNALFKPSGLFDDSARSALLSIERMCSQAIRLGENIEGTVLSIQEVLSFLVEDDSEQLDGWLERTSANMPAVRNQL